MGKAEGGMRKAEWGRRNGEGGSWKLEIAVGLKVQDIRRKDKGADLRSLKSAALEGKQY